MWEAQGPDHGARGGPRLPSWEHPVGVALSQASDLPSKFRPSSKAGSHLRPLPPAWALFFFWEPSVSGV